MMFICWNIHWMICNNYTRYMKRDMVFLVYVDVLIPHIEIKEIVPKCGEGSLQLDIMEHLPWYWRLLLPRICRFDMLISGLRVPTTISTFLISYQYLTIFRQVRHQMLLSQCIKMYISLRIILRMKYILSIPHPWRHSDT